MSSVNPCKWWSETQECTNWNLKFDPYFWFAFPTRQASRISGRELEEILDLYLPIFRGYTSFMSKRSLYVVACIWLFSVSLIDPECSLNKGQSIGLIYLKKASELTSVDQSAFIHNFTRWNAKTGIRAKTGIPWNWWRAIIFISFSKQIWYSSRFKLLLCDP